MSEYKTYACDKCGKHEAQRLKFFVDLEHDLGQMDRVFGCADLCPEHLAEAYQALVAEHTMERQNKLWKEILNSRKKVA